jgi:hypothetical protein
MKHFTLVYWNNILHAPRYAVVGLSISCFLLGLTLMYLIMGGK